MLNIFPKNSNKYFTHYFIQFFFFRLTKHSFKTDQFSGYEKLINIWYNYKLLRLVNRDKEPKYPLGRWSILWIEARLFKN